MVEVRAVDLHQLSSLGLQLLQVGVVGLQHAWLEGLGPLELLNHTQLHAAQVSGGTLLRSLDNRRDGVGGGGRVVGVVPRNNLVQQRGI